MVWMLLVVLVGFILWKMYRHRNVLSQLSKREWLQYIASLVTSVAIAALIILGGAKMLQTWPVASGSIVYEWLIVGFALFCASYFLAKLMPVKLKSYYE